MIWTAIFTLGMLQAVGAKPSEMHPLKGVENVCVIVEQFDSDAKRAGLDEAMIQTDVELKFRSAGFRVLPVKNPQPYGCAVFAIELGLARPASEPLTSVMFAYMVKAELFELSEVDPDKTNIPRLGVDAVIFHHLVILNINKLFIDYHQVNY